MLLVFVSFLINYSENGVCEVYYLQNVSENEEDLLSCPKVVIKKETFNSNYDSSSGFSEGIQWARSVSQGPEELSLNTWITFFKT